MQRFPLAASAVILAALISHPAQSQVARSGGGGGANVQLMQQMQQLASERTSLQAENAKLKKDLDDTRKERDALKNGQQALTRRVQASEVSLKELKESAAGRASTQEQELAQTKERMQELVAKFRETLQSMREIETDRTTSKQTLATRDQELKVCVDRNLALYKLNQEVLTRLEHQGLWSRMAQAEPFTKIKRVELENLVDEYKSRADDQRVSPPKPAETPATGAPSPGPSSPSPPIASKSNESH